MHRDDQFTEPEENINFSCLMLYILWDIKFHLTIPVWAQVAQARNNESISSQETSPLIRR